ncbi:response regulator [Hyalangium minutum]|uniref:Alkaline phosphatase synthesis transcriptional regulatory protein PhoP n=1 Tax=Hyalangium minutum TaxID=394096 RepID=A0A085W898_9BACT|nr:response regulator [Hyalangium minutum]KFE63911.1 Alkaline phosphatase synthesis transcriptional regulatory protein PhoP [Hyalangium minutum]
MSAGGSILVVDDDEDIRDILSLLLCSEGYEVDSARDGLDALDHLRAGEPPSVILLDMMMPRMDGEDFLTSIHDTPQYADIPVVLISGHHAAREKAAQLAAADCLVKPIDADELLSVVRKYVPNHPRMA